MARTLILFLTVLTAATSEASFKPPSLSSSQKADLTKGNVVFVKAGQGTRAVCLFDKPKASVWRAIEDRRKAIHYTHNLTKAAYLGQGVQGGKKWIDIEQEKKTSLRLTYQYALRYTYSPGQRIDFKLSPPSTQLADCNVSQVDGFIEIFDWEGKTLLVYQIKTRPGGPAAMVKSEIRKSMANLRGYLARF